MKIFVNLAVLVSVSVGVANAADSEYIKATNSLSMQQPQLMLRIEQSPVGASKFSESTATGCAPEAMGKNSKLIDWAKDNQSVSKFFTCSDSRNLNLLRFSSSSCSEAINCRRNVNEMQVNPKLTENLMNEVVAKDYAKNVLAQNAESMDRLETLKKFAVKKYDEKIADKCASRYQPKKSSKGCNLPLLDEVFVEQQKGCSFGNGCYNKSEANVVNFSAYKEKEKVPKLAFVVEYNEYRLSERANKIYDEDSSYLQDLASLVTSDEFKNASADQKGEMFLKKLDSGSGDRYRDPILAYDFDSVSEKDKLKKMMKYKQLMSVIDNKDMTRESFIAGFENFRKKRAEIILNEPASCSNTPDINLICEDMTTLAQGKTLPKDSLSVEHLSSRNLRSEKDFDKFKSMMGAGFNEYDYDTLVNAKRCLSFGLASEKYSSGLATSSSAMGTIVGNMLANSGPSNDAIESSKSQVSSYVNETSATKSDTAPKTLDPKSIESEADSSSSINSALANSQVPTSNFANSFNQSFTPGSYGLDDDAEKKDEAADKKEDTSSIQAAANTANNDKMNDLMKRLTSAEEKVEKMKADNEEAEADRVKQKKIDEENALIKDLKGQISDLKSAKDKKEIEKTAAVAAPVIDQSRSQSSNVYANSGNSSSGIVSRQDSAPKAIADNFDSGRAPSSVSSASSGSSRSSMSNAILSSSNGADNKTLPSGIVITTIDGMSSEKATQTISNRILELNGTPFYIEEGGMVKEIIAVVKDGKVLLDEKGNPIYEKIVKGKVGDKKFAKIKDKARAPAAITDAADLKRDQEEKMKRERAEYLKLKNLTNGILKKN